MVLVNGRAKEAERYPPALCAAIVGGLKKHVDLDVLEDSVEFDYAEMLKPDVDAAAAAIAALKEERGIASKATSYDVPF